MPLNDKALKNHPGLNPAYFSIMERRREAQQHNRNLLLPSMKMAVPKQPNKYVPHYGAKEAAKYAGRKVL